MVVKKIYDRLLSEYGAQGWWPLLSYDGVNPTKTGSVTGYHPGDYSFPRSDDERFEIICGALLTQNTNWQNVEKALINLRNKGLLNARGVLNCDIDLLKDCIRPAGYFNQKAERLKILAEFFVGLDRVPMRDELLDLKGVGPETCDSILLYAYSVPSFVVDAYTKRMVRRLGLVGGDNYDDIKSFFENNLDKDYRVYQEFHALIVEYAKRRDGFLAECLFS
jgi:endonuclease III related protein